MNILQRLQTALQKRLTVPEPQAVTLDLDPQLMAKFWQQSLQRVNIQELVDAGDGKQRRKPLYLCTIDQARQGIFAQPEEGATIEEENQEDVVVLLGVETKGWQNRAHDRLRPEYLMIVPATLGKSQVLLPRIEEMPSLEQNFYKDERRRWLVDIFNMESFRAYLNSTPVPNAQLWQPWWTFCLGAFLAALEVETEGQGLALIETLFQQSVVQRLRQRGKLDWIIGVYESPGVPAATRNFHEVYTALQDPNRDKGNDLHLFKRFVTGTTGRLTPDILLPQHANVQTYVFSHDIVTLGRHIQGHMDSRTDVDGTFGREMFALDPSQRRAVRHAVTLRPGEILAVNGPPGTGKTSMLKAVIASYWVQAALEQRDPPIIVACGATNQSVTNVINAFKSVPHSEGNHPLAMRWNPMVDSYGAYFPSEQQKQNARETVLEYQGIELAPPGKRCLLSFFERRNPFDPNVLDELERAYITASKGSGITDADNIENILVVLHHMLTRIAVELPDKLRALAITVQPASDAGHTASGRGIPEAELLSILQEVSQLVHTTAPHKDADRLFQLHQALVAPASNEGRETWRRIMKEADGKLELARHLLIEELIDLRLRPEAFHVAARYFEGRFLLAQRRRLHVRSEMNVDATLRRLAMLCPCVVTTLNTLPRLVGVAVEDPATRRNFGFGMIDVLIVDEAGQALPETGGAIFSLAKRALIVGDQRQLEPIANMEIAGEMALLDQLDAEALYDEIERTGKAPSSGSILTAAKHASGWNDELGRGITLRYHYRCRREIIQYCNALCYDNTLIARTKSGQCEEDFPPLSWVESAKNAMPQAGSWVNKAEARLLAEWVAVSWPKIKGHFGDIPIHNILAILTPYRPQVLALREALQEAFTALPPEHERPDLESIKQIVINTVHALQGAERPLILFSAVYGKENGSSPLFDRGASLLNVAVSRAQHSFVLFGDPELFFRGGDQPPSARDVPSVLLGKHLRTAGRRLFPTTLVIVEAGGKRSTIQELLGPECRVMATNGAVRSATFPDRALLSRGLRPLWKWDKEGVSESTIAAIADEAKKVREIVLATDADLMGESIAWHIRELLVRQLGDAVRPRIRRVRLGAIDQKNLQAAFANPDDLNDRAAQAALLREQLDIVIAHCLMDELQREPTETEATAEKQYLDELRALGLSVQPHRVGVGRVRAALLRLLLLRELAGSAQPEKRWRIVVKLMLSGGTLEGYIVTPDDSLPDVGSIYYAKDEDTARKALSRLPTSLDGFEPAALHRELIDFAGPPIPTTALLLARAWRLHKLLPDETMSALQALYEGDIRRLDGKGQAQEQEGNAKHVHESAHTRVHEGGATVNFAHAPVGPIDPTLTPDRFLKRYAASDVQKQVYGLVYEASCDLVTPRIEHLRLSLTRKHDRRVALSFQALHKDEMGWVAKDSAILERYVNARSNRNQSSLIFEACATPAANVTYEIEAIPGRMAPFRLDELIEQMAHHGIGRPSTFSNHLTRLVKDKLVVLDKLTGEVTLSEKGRFVALQLLTRAPFISDVTTSRMVDDGMEAVAEGRVAPEKYAQNIITHVVGKAESDALTTTLWHDLHEIAAFPEVAAQTPSGGVVQITDGLQVKQSNNERGY